MGIWWCFCFRCLSGLHTMQELSYPGTITLVSIWFRTVSTQIKTRVHKYSLTLTYPPNINIEVVLQFWYSRGGPLIPFFLTLIINTHAFHLYTGPTLASTCPTHCKLKHMTNFWTRFTCWLCTSEMEKIFLPSIAGLSSDVSKFVLHRLQLITSPWYPVARFSTGKTYTYLFKFCVF